MGSLPENPWFLFPFPFCVLTSACLTLDGGFRSCPRHDQCDLSGRVSVERRGYLEPKASVAGHKEGPLTTHEGSFSFEPKRTPPRQSVGSPGSDTGWGGYDSIFPPIYLLIYPPSADFLLGIGQGKGCSVQLGSPKIPADIWPHAGFFRCSVREHYTGVSDP